MEQVYKCEFCDEISKNKEKWKNTKKSVDIILKMK